MDKWGRQGIQEKARTKSDGNEDISALNAFYADEIPQMKTCTYMSTYVWMK